MAKAEKAGQGRVLPNEAANADKARETTEKLFGLLRSNKEAIDEIAEIRSGIGNETKDFLEATGFNKVALGFVARLHRQTPETRADILATLDKLLPLARREWMKNTTPDMLDPERNDPERPTDPDASDAAAEMGADDESEEGAA
mgnify:FL=1